MFSSRFALAMLLLLAISVVPHAEELSTRSAQQPLAERVEEMLRKGNSRIALEMIIAHVRLNQGKSIGINDVAFDKTMDFLHNIDWSAATTVSAKEFEANRVRLFWDVSRFLHTEKILISERTESTNILVITGATFLECLKANPALIPPKEYVAGLLFMHRKKLELLDAGFNPKKLPYANMLVPGSDTYASGISPEDVKEPELRKAYEAALDENRKYTEFFNTQIRLRRITLPHYEQRIAAAYAAIAVDENGRTVLREAIESSTVKDAAIALIEATLKQ